MSSYHKDYSVSMTTMIDTEIAGPVYINADLDGIRLKEKGANDSISLTYAEFGELSGIVNDFLKRTKDIKEGQE